MGLIAALVVGILVGGIAMLFTPGREPGRLQFSALLGIAGSLVAFLMGRAAGWYGPSSAPPGIIASVLGALLVLASYRSVRGTA